MQATCILVCSKVEPLNPNRFVVFCFDDDYIIETSKQKHIKKLISNVDNPHIYFFAWDSKFDAMQKLETMGVPCERIIDMGKPLSKWNDLRDVFNKYVRVPGKHGYYTVSGYDFTEAKEYNF